MAQNQKKDEGSQPARDSREAGVNAQVGAVEDPSPIAKADETAAPVPNDAKLDQPPLRSPKAPVDLATSLGEGAGAHQPPDPKKYDAAGRPRD